MRMFPTITQNDAGQPVSVSVTFEDGRTFTAVQKDRFFERTLAAVRAFDSDAVLAIMEPISKLAEWSSTHKQISIDRGIVKFEQQPVTGALVNAILDRIVLDLSIEPFVKCLLKLMSNPSPYVRENLWGFMTRNSMALTEDGDLCLYKMVEDDYWSWYRDGVDPVTVTDLNDPSLVYQLQSGRVPYYAGTRVHMDRDRVNSDSRVSCSNGLHVGAYGYNMSCERTLVVAVDPANVVAIPYSDREQVMRVSDLTVIGEIGERLPREDIIHNTFIAEGVVIDHGRTDKFWDNQKIVDEAVNADGEPNEPARVDPKTGGVSLASLRNFLRGMFGEK